MRRHHLLLAAIVTSLALHLRADLAGAAWQVYLFKPLTTMLIIALAMTHTGGARRYRAAVILGLLCSLAGDIFLMLPSDRFVAGLASFLAAHLCYLVAFTSDGGPGRNVRLAAPWIAWFVLLVAILAPHLGPLLPPVIVYGIALGGMAWQAWERRGRVGTTAASRAAWGATLFVASDTALALNRFLVPFSAHTAVVMTTYIAAQALIASSIPRARESSSL